MRPTRQPLKTAGQPVGEQAFVTRSRCSLSLNALCTDDPFVFLVPWCKAYCALHAAAAGVCIFVSRRRFSVRSRRLRLRSTAQWDHAAVCTMYVRIRRRETILNLNESSSQRSVFIKRSCCAVRLS